MLKLAKLYCLPIVDESNPSYGNYTQVVVPVHDENMNTIALSELNSTGNAWHAVLTKVFPNAIQVEVTSSPNAIVGEYRMQIDSRNGKSESRGTAQSFVSYQVDTRILLLFNAWNKSMDPIGIDLKVFDCCPSRVCFPLFFQQRIPFICEVRKHVTNILEMKMALFGEELGSRPDLQRGIIHKYVPDVKV